MCVSLEDGLVQCIHFCVYTKYMWQLDVYAYVACVKIPNNCNIQINCTRLIKYLCIIWYLQLLNKVIHTHSAHKAISGLDEERQNIAMKHTHIQLLAEMLGEWLLFLLHIEWMAERGRPRYAFEWINGRMSWLPINNNRMKIMHRFHYLFRGHSNERC